MSFIRAKAYHEAMTAELSQLNGTDLAKSEYLWLLDVASAFTVEMFRLGRQRRCDIPWLLSIVQHLAVTRDEVGDEIGDREFKRRRIARYRWCVREMRSCFHRALYLEAKEAYAAGQWFSGIGRLRVRIRLFAYFGRLELACLRLHVGLLADVDDVARDLCDIAADYAAYMMS